MEEPGIDPRQDVNFLRAHPLRKGLRDGEHPERRWHAERLPHVAFGEEVRIQPGRADVQHPHRLLDDLWERAADGHHLAHALHLAADASGHSSELAQVPARELADDIVERGLEKGRGLLSDPIRDLGQREAQRQLGGHVGERVAGCLAGQGAGAGKAGVDLDHPVVGACWIERILDVALADDAQVPDNVDGESAEELVLLVVQGLSRRDDDRLAGVNAHRVEVLHVADGDAVVLLIADDLVLDLLPAAQIFLDKDLLDAAIKRPLEGGSISLDSVTTALPRPPSAKPREA